MRSYASESSPIPHQDTMDSKPGMHCCVFFISNYGDSRHCNIMADKVTYPIAADPKREIISQLNMVDPDEKDSSGDNLPSRALHIVGPDKKVRACLVP